MCRWFEMLLKKSSLPVVDAQMHQLLAVKSSSVASHATSHLEILDNRCETIPLLVRDAVGEESLLPGFIILFVPLF